MGEENKSETPTTMELFFISGLTAVLSGGLITPLLIASTLMSLSVFNVFYVWFVL